MTWQVPGYVAEELLGFGASGEVWRARGAVTGEVVALKRLRAGREPAEQERLRQEGALLGAFQHPHVIRLHGVLCSPGGPVLVLQYAPGGTLAALVARRGPCSPGEVVGLLAPIASALAAAHAVGLVHGDLSPGNILLDGDGRPLLADLGTARLLADGNGLAFGTAGFVDPAVAAGRPVSPASDVYGLAAVGVYVLSGSALTGTAVTEGPLAVLAGYGLPDAMVRVLEQALHVDPGARPSAEVFARDLAAAGTAEPMHGDGPVAVPMAATANTHAVHNGERRPVPALEPGRHRRAALRKHLGARRWRVVARSAAAVLLVGAAAAMGLSWGYAAQTSQAAPQPVPQPARSEPVARPSWARVWSDLDARRARAFASADAMLLDQVYLPGCPALPVDLRTVRSLAARHAHATGVAHQASSVRAESVAGDSVTLLVVDRMRGYDIRDAAGRVLAHVPPRSAERTLQVRLARTPGGWRIAELSEAAR